MAYLLFCFFILVMCSMFSESFAACAENLPLKLTPYLSAGQVKEAQDKARVSPNINGVESFSGYFTVNEECGNNLFFWFLSAQNNWKKAPVLLWYSGVLGDSSLVGMFTEIGPFDYTKKKDIINNEYPWTKNNNVLFLDLPVGSGFSFTEKGCYAENKTAVAVEIYSALLQFFTMFPDLKENAFYLVGEWNAALFLPPAATLIHKQNNAASVKINLKGILIGNPFIDVRCIKSGPYLYELGMVDENLRDKIKKQENTLSKLVDEKNYTGAVDFDGRTYGELFGQLELPNFSNIIEDAAYTFEFPLYLRNYKIRERIHVGNALYNGYRNNVSSHMRHKLYEPSTQYIEELLKADKYIVGFYNGQLDLKSPYPSLPCVLRQLKWDGATKYLKTNRSDWHVDGRLAGWFKVAGNLFEVAVRDSGLYVPRDQGSAALELITAVTSDKPGSKLLSKLATK